MTDTTTHEQATHGPQSSQPILQPIVGTALATRSLEKIVGGYRNNEYASTIAVRWALQIVGADLSHADLSSSASDTLRDVRAALSKGAHPADALEEVSSVIARSHP